MSNLLPKNRRRFFFSKRSRGNSRKDCLHTMKILRQQNTNDTESNRSLEQILSVQEDLKNTVEVASYLNNLCATLTSAKELPSEEGFYKAVCKRYVLNIKVEIIFKWIARYVLLDVSSIRAITYRILRKASQIHDDLSLLLQIHMDIFAIRSLELDTNSSEERMEALKLCVMMLSRRKERTKSLSNGLVEENFSDTSFPENICRAIISVANSFFPMRFDRAKAKEGEDELAFSCFVVIIEQAAVAPDLILNSIDTGWIVEFLTRTILNDRSSTVVCRILCAWLDSPRECLSNNSFHLRNFSQIFSTLLRTWAGLLACAASDDQNTSFVSALSFLDYVGLNPLTHANSRKIYDLVIECCCEVLELSYSKVRFTDWPCTVGFYSTVYHPDAYKCSVRDDFILAEHEMFLRIDQALSRVILQDPDDQIALKATLLMHDLLIASSICLPMEWKLHVLSLPTLMHGACELMSSRKHPLDDGQYRVGKISFTYADPRNIIILFNRLDILKNVTLAQKTQPFPITNLELFVQSNSVVTRLSKSTLSRRIFNDNDRAADVGTMLGKLLLKAVGSDGRLCWPIVDKLFQLLENNYACRDVPRKYFEKCYGIFRMVFFFITPVKGLLIKARADRLVIICCCRAIYLSLMFAARETQYKELISNFINDFIMSISGDALLNGPLSPKNLVNSSAMYYFAFVGAISAAEEGRRMLEATTLLQKLVCFLLREEDSYF
uniref:Rapamycin-insensitive companion of mTOR N-terminal domain-containing protein n=1 Tax=Setaria digitata TaxID=48799 RepID=A0A915PW46_9BILA